MINHYISVYQDRYATCIVAKYLYNATANTSTNFYMATLKFDVIFTKDYASTSDDKVDKLTREFYIQYRVFIRSYICF